jgi:hypothetical protein
MKKLLLIAFLSLNLCFITGNQVSAQNKQPYQPMALEGAHWSVIYQFIDPNGGTNDELDFYQYVIRGDTTVNNIDYKKIYYRSCLNYYTGTPWLIEIEYLFGFLRDDTLSRKVYAINLAPSGFFGCPVSEEFLLYDFEVSLGDTLNLCMLNEFGSPIVYSLGYSFVFGKERKLINGGESGVEGIGTYYGLFEWGMGSKNSDDSKGWMFSLDGYCIGTDQECGCQWVGIEESEKPVKLKVSPNPAKEIVNFEFGNIQNLQQAQLRCYDVFGNLLHSEAVVPGQKDVILDISSWPSGMYVAVVYSNGGVVGKSKFVVNQ